MPQLLKECVLPFLGGLSPRHMTSTIGCPSCISTRRRARRKAKLGSVNEGEQLYEIEKAGGRESMSGWSKIISRNYRRLTRIEGLNVEAEAEISRFCPGLFLFEDFFPNIFHVLQQRQVLGLQGAGISEVSPRHHQPML